MIGKRTMFLVAAAVMVLATAGILWAVCPSDFSRPIDPSTWDSGEPSNIVHSGGDHWYWSAMDYVPQEQGIFDTLYQEHGEHNCRKCHGNDMRDRHHLGERNNCEECYPPGESGCLYCHPVEYPPGNYPKGDSWEYEEGVRRAHDCTAKECHGTEDDGIWLQSPPDGHGWHHNTDIAAAENCIACHSPNLIEEVTDLRDFERDPPQIDPGITPTPYACENCHWQQDIDCEDPDCKAQDNEHYLCDGDEDSSAPGHPSTYDHYDDWGTGPTYFEYPKPIEGNKRTHHMKRMGAVYWMCYKCHSIDPETYEVDPTDIEYIRYCEICHSPRSLHGILPHVGYHPGWVPEGFHTDSACDPVDWCDDVISTQYRTGDTAGGTPIEILDPNSESFVPPRYYGQVDSGIRVTEEYTPEEQCEGCHFDLPEWEPETSDCTPDICDDFECLSPISGSCGVYVTIRGECFGVEHIIGRAVQLSDKDAYDALVADANYKGGWNVATAYVVGDLVKYNVPPTSIYECLVAHTGYAPDDPEYGVNGSITPYWQDNVVWLNVPIHAWTDTLIEWELPCWTPFLPGNYYLRVLLENGKNSGNKSKVFTIEDHPTLMVVTPDSGGCGTQLTLQGTGGFMDKQDILPSNMDGYHGISHVVDLVYSDEQAYTVQYIGAGKWTNTQIKVNLGNFYRDRDDPVAVNYPPDTPPTRNFAQDEVGEQAPGTEDVCTDPANEGCAGEPYLGDGCCCPEPTIPDCDCLAEGMYSIYVKAIYYGDDDNNDALTCGDTIFQVEMSDPVYFTVTNEPFINKLNPRQIERNQRLKIYGNSFGDLVPGAEVHIGKKGQYPDGGVIIPYDHKNIKLWSDTLIKVKVKAKSSWEGKKIFVWVKNSNTPPLNVSNKLPLWLLAPL